MVFTDRLLRYLILNMTMSQFATHGRGGALSYQNIDLVLRGGPGTRHPQFLHARGGRAGRVTLGRGNSGLYVTVRSHSRRGGWRFRACVAPT